LPEKRQRGTELLPKLEWLLVPFPNKGNHHQFPKLFLECAMQWVRGA
jgi:hypothetical protein